METMWVLKMNVTKEFLGTRNTCFLEWEHGSKTMENLGMKEHVGSILKGTGST